MNNSNEERSLKLEQLHQKEADLRARGDYGGALKILDQMIDLDNSYSAAFNNKGAILMMLGRYNEALPSLERAVNLDTDNAQAWNNCGYCHFRTGDPEGAIDYYRGARNRGYTHEGLNHNLGMALLAVGQTEEALTEWEIALRKNPLSQNTRAEIYRLAQAFGILTPGNEDLDETTVEEIRRRLADYEVIVRGVSPEVYMLVRAKRSDQ